MASLLEEATALALTNLAGMGARALAPGLISLPGPGGQRLVRVLGRWGPHRRGGRGDLGLHWVLEPGPEEMVALVDLSRSLVWLLPREEFQRRAQPWPGGRLHLDWIVLPLGRGKRGLPREEEWELYLVRGGASA
jgi:hypothetical protein